MALIQGSLTDGLTDELNSVSQDAEHDGNTAARDLKGTPRYLRENSPDGFGGVFDQSEAGAEAGHSPAMVEYEGAPKGHDTSSEAFKSTSKAARARRARNKRDLKAKRNVVDTTKHPAIDE